MEMVQVENQFTEKSLTMKILNGHISRKEFSQWLIKEEILIAPNFLLLLQRKRH